MSGILNSGPQQGSGGEIEGGGVKRMLLNVAALVYFAKVMI